MESKDTAWLPERVPCKYVASPLFIIWGGGSGRVSKGSAVNVICEGERVGEGEKVGGKDKDTDC